MMTIRRTSIVAPKLNLPVRGTHKKSPKIRMGGRLLLLPKPGDHVQSLFPLNDPATGWTVDSRRCGAVARKIGMTMEWDEWGAVHALTILELDKCQVLELKTKEKHGYTAVKLGVGSKFITNMTRADMGEFAKAGVDPKRYVEEVKVTPDALVPVGTEITVRHFVPGQKVDICGKTRGRGFMGAMRRWGFKGLPATHGVSLTHRSHGATGARQDPGKVWKGKKMAGKEGNKRRMMRNCQVFELHPKLNIMMISGSVPGRRGTFVRIQDSDGYIFTSPPPFPTYVIKPGEEDVEVIRGPSPNPYKSQLPDLQPNFFNLEKFINEHPEKVYQKRWEPLVSANLPNNLQQLLNSKLRDLARAQQQELQAAGKKATK